MILHVWDSTIADDDAAVSKEVDEIIDRYESSAGDDSQGRRLQKFLPLLPALKDPSNPKHQDALDYFGRDQSWGILRWLWIQKYKLPRDDAIDLLGGEEVGGPRQVLVPYLEGDAAKTAEMMKALAGADDGQADWDVLASYAAGKINNDNFDKGTPDLMPANALSAYEAVTIRLKAEAMVTP